MIRNATAADMSELARLCLLMHEESGFSNVTVNASKITDFLVYAISNPDRFKVTIAEDDSGVYGMHIGYAQDYWFSDDIAGYDVLLYISPNKRGGMSGIRMIKSFENWAFSKGAVEVRPGCTTGISPEMTKELHERLGYETVGYTFRKVR